MLVAAFPSTDPAQIRQLQAHYPHGLLFGMLLLALVLEHLLLYVFVRWIWTRPPAIPEEYRQFHPRFQGGSQAASSQSSAIPMPVPITCVQPQVPSYATPIAIPCVQPQVPSYPPPTTIYVDSRHRRGRRQRPSGALPEGGPFSPVDGEIVQGPPGSILLEARARSTSSSSSSKEMRSDASPRFVSQSRSRSRSRPRSQPLTPAPYHRSPVVVIYAGQSRIEVHPNSVSVTENEQHGGTIRSEWGDREMELVQRGRRRRTPASSNEEGGEQPGDEYGAVIRREDA
jgi:hypothetical protein